MAYYAFLDAQNKVVEVITGVDDNTRNWEEHYGQFRGLKCKKTSYNTRGGVHALGGTPFRKNYAGIGYVYDETRDAFIAPRPFSSWKLNETSCTWEPPVPFPVDGKDYQWNEELQQWDLAIIAE